MADASILVIAPHAIDEVLGCAGAIARTVSAGGKVYPLMLFGDGSGRDAQRRSAAREAARILGTEPPEFSGLAENHGDTLPLQAVVRPIDQMVRKIRPQRVFINHGGNLHADHQAAFRAAMVVFRPQPEEPVREILAYEVLSSTEWAVQGAGFPFIPNHFIDITAALETKMAALQPYAPEMRAAPHTRSLEGVRSLARNRGLSVGLSAAEAFMVIRRIETD